MSSVAFTLARLLCMCGLLSQPLPVLAAQELLTELQRLSAQGELQIAGATVYDLPILHQFYETNAYIPAWVHRQSVNELIASIEQAWHEGMEPQDYHHSQVKGLLDGSLILEASTRDLLLTDSLVRLTYHYRLGKVDPRDYVASWIFDPNLPQTDPVLWMHEIIQSGGITAGIDRLKPSNPMYTNLVHALARYRRIAASGDWQSIASGPELRKGDRGVRVGQIRLRLLAEGDMKEQVNISPEYFDLDLELGLIRFQRRHRLEADGIAGRQTLAAMNVPVARRIDQIRVNLERARALSDIPPTAVLVDIAGFEVSLFRDGQRLLQSRAQVGLPYRSTPIFHDLITYIEFNPTWTVPPSILEEDMLPVIKGDPDYLQRHNMQVLTMDGVPVGPESVDWQAYPQQGFPYMIRQQAGPNNTLGRIKIMFPNEHLVYLHDTPSRGLFNHSERTFSSGCIRVEEVEKLVELLLDDPQQWDRYAIERTLEERQTLRVSLKNPVPVYLVYWTVQVEEGGEVHFKRDPYDRDPALLEALERPLVPDPARVIRRRKGP